MPKRPRRVLICACAALTLPLVAGTTPAPTAFAHVQARPDASHTHPSGRLTEEEAPTGAKTTYAYDANGDLVGLTDGLGHTTTFTYDAFGHELSCTDPLGKAETMAYDEAGHLTRRTDRDGEAITYAYDPDGNVTEEVAAGGESTKTAYDGFDRPVQVQSEAQTLTYA